MSVSVRNCLPQLKESLVQTVRLLLSQKCLIRGKVYTALDRFSRDKTDEYSGLENTSYFHGVYVVYSEGSVLGRLEVTNR